VAGRRRFRNRQDAKSVKDRHEEKKLDRIYGIDRIRVTTPNPVDPVNPV